MELYNYSNNIEVASKYIKEEGRFAAVAEDWGLLEKKGRTVPDKARVTI